MGNNDGRRASTSSSVSTRDSTLSPRNQKFDVSEPLDTGAGRSALAFERPAAESACTHAPRGHSNPLLRRARSHFQMSQNAEFVYGWCR